MNDLCTTGFGPLNSFYSKVELQSLELVEIQEENVPEPYQSLLVHKRDMTSTLERFHQGTIHLKVLEKEHDSLVLKRKVLLILNSTNLSVEFGAIHIYFSRFPSPAQAPILDGDLPLGSILRNFCVEYSSRPTSYFSLRSDSQMNDAFRLEESKTLFGRCNVIRNRADSVLAEIVEVLPAI